jgi:hypothetical protein
LHTSTIAIIDPGPGRHSDIAGRLSLVLDTSI